MTNVRAGSRGRASLERSPLEASRLLDSLKEQATILVVDDSATSAQLLQIHLERTGYHVIVASDGKEALVRVETELPDPII